MFISVIIATYNVENTIKNTIQSILNQSISSYEIIVVDGASTDGTINFIKEFNNTNITIISEKDNGIYDAWNKGLKIANGNWICFLGAGDLLMSNAFEHYQQLIINTHNQESLEYISAKIILTNNFYEPLRTIGKPWNWKDFRTYMCVAHVGSLHSKKLFNKYGVYDTSFKITGDYELLLRPSDKLNAAFCNAIILKMPVDGASTKWKSVIEQLHAKVKNNSKTILLCYMDFVKAASKFYIKKMIRYK